MAPRVDGVLPILRERELAGGGHKPPFRTATAGRTVAASPRALQAALERWAETISFKRCSPYHCELDPSPRSTIALAFSPDGQRFASTHGDHTVKIICCRTGRTLQVMHGHMRTPWVVRWHPTSDRTLASGSLDHHVRIWDAQTGDCINHHDFGKPIASLAFHSNGRLLAVASGHRLFMWEWSKAGALPSDFEEGAEHAWSPVVVHKTRRSLRAVHFHPHGAPLMLTAEVAVDMPNAPPGRPHFLSTPAPPTPGATADVLPAPAGMPSTPPPVVPAAGLRTYLRGRDILAQTNPGRHQAFAVAGARAAAAAADEMAKLGYVPAQQDTPAPAFIADLLDLPTRGRSSAPEPIEEDDVQAEDAEDVDMQTPSMSDPIAVEADGAPGPSGGQGSAATIYDGLHPETREMIAATAAEARRLRRGRRNGRHLARLAEVLGEARAPPAAAAPEWLVAPSGPPDRSHSQNKYQAALQRLRSDPTWLGMDPTKRQEAFESLWGQYSIKQWQERTALGTLERAQELVTSNETAVAGIQKRVDAALSAELQAQTQLALLTESAADLSALGGAGGGGDATVGSRPTPDDKVAEARRDLSKAKLAVELVQAEARTAAQEAQRLQDAAQEAERAHKTRLAELVALEGRLIQPATPAWGGGPAASPADPPAVDGGAAKTPDAAADGLESGGSAEEEPKPLRLQASGRNESQDEALLRLRVANRRAMIQQPNLAAALPALAGTLPPAVARRLADVGPQDRRRDGGVRAALQPQATVPWQPPGGTELPGTRFANPPAYNPSRVGPRLGPPFIRAPAGRLPTPPDGIPAMRANRFATGPLVQLGFVPGGGTPGEAPRQAGIWGPPHVAPPSANLANFVAGREHSQSPATPVAGSTVLAAAAAQVAAWQQELVADYSGVAPVEGDSAVSGVPNPPLGNLVGGARPPVPPHLTRWGVSSEQDAEWQALLTAQQMARGVLAPSIPGPSRDAAAAEATAAASTAAALRGVALREATAAGTPSGASPGPPRADGLPGGWYPTPRERAARRVGLQFAAVQRPENAVAEGPGTSVVGGLLSTQPPTPAAPPATPADASPPPEAAAAADPPRATGAYVPPNRRRPLVDPPPAGHDGAHRTGTPPMRPEQSSQSQQQPQQQQAPREDTGAQTPMALSEDPWTFYMDVARSMTASPVDQQRASDAEPTARGEAPRESAAQAAMAAALRSGGGGRWGGFGPGADWGRSTQASSAADYGAMAEGQATSAAPAVTAAAAALDIGRSDWPASPAANSAQVAPPTGVAMQQWQRASDVRLARILQRMEAFEEGRTYLPSTMAATRRAAQAEALPSPSASELAPAAQYGGARIPPWLRAAEQRARAGSPSSLPADGAPREAAAAGSDNSNGEPTWAVTPPAPAVPTRMPLPHVPSAAAAASPSAQDTARSAAWLAAVAREAALGNEQARVELDTYRGAAGARLHELGPAMEASVSAAEGGSPLAAAPAPVDNFWHHLEQFRPPPRPLEAIPHLNRAQQLLDAQAQGAVLATRDADLAAWAGEYQARLLSLPPHVQTQVIMALNGVNPYDVARNGPAASGAAGAALQRPAQPAADMPAATPATALLPLERPAAPAPPVSQSAPAGSLPPSMVQMGWEYPVPPPPSNALMGLMGDGPFAAGAGQPAGLPLQGDANRTADRAGGGGGDAAANVAHQAGAEAAQQHLGLAAAAAALIGSERPCRVKLKVFSFDAGRLRSTMAGAVPQIIIPDAVLCSEMGVHFSPCGRYLAACIACHVPSEQRALAKLWEVAERNREFGAGDPEPQSVVYELRIYSMEPGSFGSVVRSRQVKAPHCITSIQFSPTSEHLLIAYGRRHLSLLRSLASDGRTLIPVHTILELYRVSDMGLVSVMPSAEDEVNAAAFSPLPGHGLVYGTKTGRLRMLRSERVAPPGIVSGGAAGGRDDAMDLDGSESDGDDNDGGAGAAERAAAQILQGLPEDFAAGI